MGCDINIHLEFFNGEKWIYLYPGNLNIYDGREYKLFALLANVRNDGSINPICLPRCLPQGCCEEIVDENEFDDYTHSETWYTLDEMFNVEWYKLDKNFNMKVVSEKFCQFLRNLKKYADIAGIDYNNLRIVMWFND